MKVKTLKAITSKKLDKKVNKFILKIKNDPESGSVTGISYGGYSSASRTYSVMISYK